MVCVRLYRGSSSSSSTFSYGALKFELSFLYRCAQVRALPPPPVYLEHLLVSALSRGPSCAAPYGGLSRGALSNPGARKRVEWLPVTPFPLLYLAARFLRRGKAWCLDVCPVTGSSSTVRPPGFVESPGREDWSHQGGSRPPAAAPFCDVTTAYRDSAAFFVMRAI